MNNSVKAIFLLLFASCLGFAQTDTIKPGAEICNDGDAMTVLISKNERFEAQLTGYGSFILYDNYERKDLFHFGNNTKRGACLIVDTAGNFYLGSHGGGSPIEEPYRINGRGNPGNEEASLVLDNSGCLKLVSKAKTTCIFCPPGGTGH